MTDFELLQLAAKAVGFGEIEWVDIEAYWDIEEFHGARVINGGELWNPLADGNDALNLAVMLRIKIEIRDGCACAEWVNTRGNPANYPDYLVVPIKDNPYAAMRRVIVRAAAEIGKAMK